MPKKSGFTLVELLVTISIIAILSAIGLVAYSAVMRKGRDAKRQSDLRSIQSALEQYYADQHNYPSGNTLHYGSILAVSDKTYFNIVPNDPTAGSSYSYTALPSSCDNSSTACTSYCLYARLEDSPLPTPTPPAGCTYPASYNFLVSPP